jgi:AbrB family looped-hinge helix DNA binding protein
MAEADPLKTIVSTKGQVILPKAIRDQRRWHAGTRLTVEDTPEGVLLRPEPPFPKTTVSQVAGMLKHLYSGSPKTLEEMDQAITDEVVERHARGRY